MLALSLGLWSKIHGSLQDAYVSGYSERVRQAPETTQLPLFMDLMGVLHFQSLQLMSPLAQGLFHRAISQSGTAILKVFITSDPLKAAKVGTTPLPGLNKRGEGWRDP